MPARPIAVFDSGVGGLSVVRQLRKHLPHESIVYFGDSARVPYGTKSPRTVCRFSIECARYLLRFDPKLVVAACNTASALALDELRAALPVEVIGVVEPGARAALQAATMSNARIAVLGTEATIASEAYPKALRRLAAQTPEIVPIACPLFVPIVEEGRTGADAVSRAVIADYLAPLRTSDPHVVLLGCTHYPLLADAIREYLGPKATIVDSGEQTALVVAERLAQTHATADRANRGTIQVFVSDNPPRFRAIGARFLQEEPHSVTLVAAEEYAGLDRVDCP